MKIVFLGTPGFALPSLEAVAAAHDVVRVVTAPPRPRGRGQRAEPTPVAKRAQELGIDVMTPERLDAAAVGQLLGLAPDAGVVVAYGRMLPASLFDAIPCLNVHPSLLPRHRGAAPIPWTIWSGDRQAGVTIMRIVEELDAGPIHLQEAFPLGDATTAGELEAEASRRGAGLMREALALLAAGRLPETPQEGAATYARRLTREDEQLDLLRPAEEVARQVNALAPRPGVRVAVLERDLELRLLRGRAVAADLPPGRVRAHPEGLLIGTGAGALLVAELQPAGGRALSAADLLRGRPFLDGATVR